MVTPLKKVRTEIKESIARQELVERELKSQVVITDQEVDAYLNGKEGEEASNSNKVRLALIVLPVGGDNGTPAEVRKTGAQLVKELQGGADFQYPGAALFQRTRCAGGGGCRLYGAR